MTPPAGLHTYAVRSICTPGGGTSISATDTGYRSGTPGSVSSFVATDGTFTTKVNVAFSAPDQSPICTTTSYVVMRDGADLTTITSIPISGGPGSFDDNTMSAGIHNYVVRSVCSPGGYTSLSAMDSGYFKGSPAPAASVAATDGTFPDRVRVSFSGPNQTANCSNINYIVTRDGVDQTTIVGNPSGTPNSVYDDLSVSPGTHTYGVRSACAPGGATANSSTDTGYKAGTPAVVTGLSASDGLFSNKVNIVFTAPDQSAICSAISYVITRDGSDLTTIASLAVTGGDGNFDDLTATVGSHVYAVRSVCSPAGSSTSATDTGYWRGTPAPATAVTATDGTFSTKVTVSFTAPNQSAQCASVSYVVQRNGVDIGISPFAALSGGSGTYDDTTAVPSTIYSYGVRSFCAPGNVTTASGTDTGFRQGTAATPTSIAASDYVYADHVAISVVVPNDAAQCASRDIIISRDGTDITTITGVPVTGGTGTHDDFAATFGVHSYTARSVCTPGGTASSTVSDPGSRMFLGLTCGASSPAAASMLYSSNGTNVITALNVQNASLVRMRAYANVNGTNDLFYYPMAGGPNYTGTVALVNHASGTPEYGSVTVEILGTGQNPGDPETVCSSTTFTVVQQCALPVLTGPQGTGGLPATIGWGADAAAANGWILYEAPSLGGPYTSVGSYAQATVSTTMAGWPHKFYKLQCNASDISGNRTSAALEVWGDPSPVVTPQSFTVNNPGSYVVTPVVTDPDGGTTFTLTVTTAPLHGTTSVAGGSITYTPTPGYAGPDSFTVTATDPGGASGFAVMSATVVTPVPATPSPVVATDGLFVGRVDITWGASASAQGYRVLLGTSVSDAAPVTIADLTAPTLTYSDNSAAPAGALRYYSVIAYNGLMLSPPSAVDSGYADTPITGVSAAASTGPTTSVDMVPVFTDPDPGDTPVFSIASQPPNGVATMVANKIHYVPNGTFIGNDVFQIVGTDRAGASNTGVASVNVVCADPTAGPLIISPGRIIAGSGFTLTATYDTVSCPQSFAASVRIFSGRLRFDTASQPVIPNGADLPLVFNLASPSNAGVYTVELTISNTVTRATVVKTASIAVGNFRLPPMSWVPASPLESLDTASVNMGISPDCSILTTDASTAQADHSACLIESSGLPAGVNLTGTPAVAPWKGVPSTAGTYTSSFAISMYDGGGTKRHVADVPLPVTVTSLSLFQFTAPTTVRVKQYTGTYSFSPSQTTGPTCPLYTTLTDAQAQATPGSHSCVVEYGTLPPDSYPFTFSINGAVFDTLTRPLGWTVSIVDNAGLKHQVGSGFTSIVPTHSDLAYDLQVTPSNPYVNVTNVSVSPKSIGVDNCPLTAVDTIAQNANLLRCLFEYSPVAGLSLSLNSPDPILHGTLPSYPSTTISYSVSVYANGVKHTVVTGSKDIATQQPVPPPITLEHMRQISPDTYAVSVLGGSFAVLSTSTAQGPVNVTSLVAGETSPATFTLAGSRNAQVLYATAGPLYAPRTVDLSVQLASSPLLVTNKRVTVITVPRDGLRLRLNSPPATTPDTAPLVVTATVVQSTTAGLSYVAAEAGDWTVAFGEMTSNGVFNALTPEMPIDATGTATGSIPLPASQILRLTARATSVSGYVGYSTTLTSPTRVVTIVKGTPISGSLVPISSVSGPAPFLAIMKVNFDTQSDHAATQSVVWLRSDDNGATWNAIPQATTFQYAVRLDNGNHQFKVRFNNRNTSEPSESPPLVFSAYGLPKLSITGPTYMLPASSATLIAQSNDTSGLPIPNAFYEWSISLASTPTLILSSGSTNSIPFAPTDPGTYRVLVRSRVPGTVPTDSAAWAQAVQQIIVGIPSKPYARITGPTKVEVGTPAVFTASATTSFNLASSNLTLEGQWTLPDGTTVPGTTLNWTPTQADLALSSRPTLAYTVWVSGYQSSTAFTQTASLSLWQYIWPTFRVVSALGGSVAPANAQFNVLADNPSLIPTLEGLTYTWTVPPAIAVTGTPGARLSGIVNFGGAFSVNVVVADARGHSTTLTGDITMTNAPPIVVDLVAQNLSHWSHAPITLGVTARTSGGHPSDAITSYSYSLDGVPTSLPNQSTARFDLSSPGSYNVRVDVNSRMGASATKTVLVNVPTNTAPNCSPSGSVATNRRSITLKANCVDPDGSITRYSWSINGVPVSLSVGAGWTANLPASQVWPVQVDVVATDDGGLQSTGSVTFP